MEEEDEDFRHDRTFKTSEDRKQRHVPLDGEKQISVDPLSLNQVSHAMPASSPTLMPSKLSFRRKHRSRKRKPPHPAITPLHLRHSTELTVPAINPGLRRSKSCGEGRASSPSAEFDIISRIASKEQIHGARDLYRRDLSSDESGETDSEKDYTFKCGALCLFISKKKPAPAVQRTKTEQQGGFGVSRVASLERFECVSWASAAIIDQEDRNDESGPLSYFDLPLELMRCSATDSCSPEKTAFVFEKDLKGVLKKNGDSKSVSRRSCESPARHVRFSTSAPTSYPASPSLSPCITPRLARARDEFNALLEATGG